MISMVRAKPHVRFQAGLKKVGCDVVSEPRDHEDRPTRREKTQYQFNSIEEERQRTIHYVPR